MKLSYELNDPCYILAWDGSPLHGRVVAELTIPNHPAVHYIIEPFDADYPHLEVRDALLMSETLEGLRLFTGDVSADPELEEIKSLLAQDEYDEEDNDDEQLNS
jgi:hypothetical protein